MHVRSINIIHFFNLRGCTGARIAVGILQANKVFRQLAINDIKYFWRIHVLVYINFLSHKKRFYSEREEAMQQFLRMMFKFEARCVTSTGFYTQYLNQKLCMRGPLFKWISKLFRFPFSNQVGMLHLHAKIRRLNRSRCNERTGGK